MNIFKRLLCTTILLSVLTPLVNAQSGELIDHTFNHDELSREYSIYVPEDYTSEEEWPLILNFHGYSGDVPDHIDRTQMHEFADDMGFLIAYPVGLSITRNPEILPAFVPATGAGWSVPGFSNERNELEYFESLLSDIESGFSINQQRIHTTGLSLGGYMAAYVATQMPDIIASFASVAGHFTNETTDLIDDSTKISGIMIHGTSDAITNYNGLDNQYESVPESAGLLSNLNQCSSESEETNLPDLDSSDNTTVTLIEYLGCKNERQVKVYRVNNGGHRWPGSGRVESAQVLGNNSLDINSSKLILEFFNQHQVEEEKSFYQKKEQWQTIVDEFWGNSISLSEKQRLFNEYADVVDENFTLFGFSDFDWDSLRTSYYGRINEDLSDGAFAGLVSKFSTEFKELHARFFDGIAQVTPIKHGTPVYFYNTFDVSHFGATLALQPDSSLLVVKTIKDHPLDLMPGDRVVGYEGIPWTHLTKELFEAELPGGGYLASTPEAIQNFLMTNAGNNWHLFNTIDVIKFGADSTINLSLEPMFSTVPEGSIFTGEIFNNPQLPIAGITQPDLKKFTFEGAVKYGIIDTENLISNTRVTKKVGYIYVSNHGYNEVEAEFLEAVEYMMTEKTDALIIDLRFNPGGYINPTNGLAKLFNEPENEVLGVLDKKVRCKNGGLTDLCEPGGVNLPVPGWFDWKPDPDSYYEGEIAVLIGPETQSMAEYFAYQLAEHPMAQTFGRPTNGAFSGNTLSGVDLGERWQANIVNYHLVETSDPNTPLARKALVPDNEVWMNMDDVRNGVDTIVDKALEWIEPVINNTEDNQSIPKQFSLQQNYPNPFNPSTNISFTLLGAANVQLKVYNLLGQEVASLVNEKMNSGQHTVNFNASQLSSGVYIYRLITGNESVTKKMMLIK